MHHERGIRETDLSGAMRRVRGQMEFFRVADIIRQGSTRCRQTEECCQRSEGSFTPFLSHGPLIASRLFLSCP